ncbi:MAG: ABC transporter ATP-binding protein [Caldilineales bacterium]
MALLEIRDVSSGYGELQIIWNAALAVEQGQLTALVGSNGAGKTTLLRTIVGQIKPRQGEVWFEGQDVSRLPSYQKAEMGLILVPEGRQLFTEMSVRENMEMGATPRRGRGKMNANMERCFTLFPRLKERATQKAGTLSGGEQQMLAVSRGIMSDPKVLMIDELSLGLAPVLTLDLFQSLRKLRAEGITVLLVEQNVRMALKVSDYTYVLSEGKVEMHGPSREVEQDEAVRASYLGL